jgi:sigma-B regulation protein RsbU (phosphoserine phosphatase)
MADIPLLPAPAPGSRVDALRAWLTGTFAGRALLVGAAIKIVALLLSLVIGRSRGLGAVDAIGDVALVAATAALAFRLYGDAKRRLLWRVRRKLILSYMFIGFVPVLLVIVLFLVSGALLFFNLGSYMLRNRINTVVEQTRFLAQSGAIDVQHSRTLQEVRDALSRRQAAATHYPSASYALVPAAGDCTSATPEPRSLAREAAGPWSHMPAPVAVPEWLTCEDFASLITTSDANSPSLIVRSVARPEGTRNAVIVDVPIDEALTRELRAEMGITMGAVTPVEIDRTPAPARSTEPSRVQPSTRQADPSEPIEWVAFLDYVDWSTGTTSTAAVNFRMGLGAVYRYLLGPSIGSVSSNFGRILVLFVAIVGVLFLIIQAVALVMGLTLARSITGSVHELFVGTERVRRGDFQHKIAILSRDQLGELAASFNSMTGSIEELLQQKAEKERLEQELRIARSIQMSLLPHASLSFPGVSLSGHCEPAREVGGDYYDFLPLDDTRMGILIADVAGKGTSAALYMAELKGIVLSLSQRHASPRELLIDANRIISKHLDARSFITMTYAVVDLSAHTMTMARAGHCPLVYVPGPHAGSRTPKALQPDGMVLGLQFDTGEIFNRTLEELTVPLGPGDLFLLYTDGISEAMNVEGDYFGEARLADLALQHADLRSDELSARILGEVKAFAGSAAQHDDMTMVLFKIEDR